MELFTGSLNANKVYTAFYNTIISIDVYAKNVRSNINSLVDANRTDGTMYGDTKIKTFGDTKFPRDWEGDASGATLLNTARNKNVCQTKITIDTFKIIEDTKDNYLSKQAWLGEGSFANFHGMLDTLVKETKDIYEYRTYGVKVGTTIAETAKINELNIVTPYVEDKLKRDTLAAQTISEALSNLFDNQIKDVTRDFNEFVRNDGTVGYEMSFNPEDFEFIWNPLYKNYINKIGLPSLFHLDKLNFNFEYTLPAKMFGIPNATATVADGTTTRAREYLVLKDSNNKEYEIPAGELIPVGLTAPAGKSYVANSSIALVIMHKDNLPYMSGFDVETEFFNPKGLYSNRYLIFGRNTLETVGLPMIRVNITPEEAPAEPETPVEPETPGEGE